MQALWPPPQTHRIRICISTTSPGNSFAEPGLTPYSWGEQTSWVCPPEGKLPEMLQDVGERP